MQTDTPKDDIAQDDIAKNNIPENKIIVRCQKDGSILHFAGRGVKAGLGYNGVIAANQKQEGDGKTPLGQWPLRQIYYRADRLTLPPLALTSTIITPRMGWCDDPAHAAYNQEVALPFDGSHETLWRDDHAYDVIIPLGYNDAPAIAGRGSAIFFHILHDGRDHTEGCIAIPKDAMMAMLPQLSAATSIIITTDD